MEIKSDGVVRRANQNDVNQIATLYDNFFPEHIMVRRGFLNNPEYIAQRLENFDEFWAVEQLESEIRGVAALAISTPVGLGEIERVCVGIEHRNNGIAKKLLAKLITESKRRDLGFVEAFARGDQPSMQAAFEKNGFRVYGVSPRFEIVHEGKVVREQFVHMGLELKPLTIDEQNLVLIPNARSVYEAIHK